MADKRFLPSAFGQEESGTISPGMTRRSLLAVATGLSAAIILPPAAEAGIAAPEILPLEKQDYAPKRITTDKLMSCAGVIG